MKKLLCILLSVFMLFAFAACSDEKDNDSESKAESSEAAASGSEIESSLDSSSEASSEAEEVSETERKTRTIKVLGESIYVDASTEYRAELDVNSQVLTRDYDSVLALTYEYDDAYNGDLNGVIPFLNDGFINDIALKQNGYLGGNKIEIKTSEEVTINGFDGLKFQGTVSAGEWDCHVYGYAFIINEIPCAVIGLVSHREQPADLIATINAEIDAMAATIRTEE